MNSSIERNNALLSAKRHTIAHDSVRLSSQQQRGGAADALAPTTTATTTTTTTTTVGDDAGAIEAAKPNKGKKRAFHTHTHRLRLYQHAMGAANNHRSEVSRLTPRLRCTAGTHEASSALRELLEIEEAAASPPPPPVDYLAKQEPRQRKKKRRDARSEAAAVEDAGPAAGAEEEAVGIGGRPLLRLQHDFRPAGELFSVPTRNRHLQPETPEPTSLRPFWRPLMNKPSRY